ncbi:hypothetical protein A5724_29105 [Mycobacterium sp. ACS1612]|uniref:DUF5336 domain-containing protein n=1 Tax=Mycobacterium sp. ACS1612 TaxID=1834117 RepID=UPI0007FC0A43|nr:DUF5336 domain-containing protein [Mycobacterium sp. ACS1612]OBF27682.1 hypothetical protein A5724_29105 [Mycobacterium sp. ACS1612]
MTYPPGSPGYPQAQQPTTQFAAPTQQFGKLPEPASAPAAEGPSKLPFYLTAAVAALGLAVYVSSYGPLFASAGTDLFTPTLLDLGVVASLLAGLIAGVALVPKQKSAPALVAVLSVLGFLLAIAIVLTAPEGVEIKWGLYLIIAFGVVQAIVAVAVLLFDAGVISPPAPKPRYEQQQQYGQYGAPGPYYGQPHQPGPPHQQQQQRPGYGSPYGGGYPGAGQSSGGFSSGPQSGPPTPPTGFPTYGQPPSSGSSSNASNAPTTQVPTQPSSSTQSGPPPS